MKNVNFGESVISSQGSIKNENDKSKIVNINQMQDELRQPELRNKLQREILYLKKNIGSLNKQIQTLKKANEVLQKSAKTFMDSNQKVITKWQDDYQNLIVKMGELTRFNDDLKRQNMNDK